MSKTVSVLTRSLLVLSSLLVASCSSGDLHVASAPSATTYIESFERTPTSPSLGHMRLRADVCTGVDARPVYRPLDADDFIRFLKSQNLEARVVRARHDLVFADVTNAGTRASVRFRIAILPTAGAAGHELHEALLQHGEGAWGVRRSNLAVLGPNGPLDDVIVLSVRTKLACWGVLMVAGHDDTFVVPGGYTEL